MTEMAPALTDTAAHSATFKLPASPANPGFDSLYSLSSPDLPDPDPVLSTKQQSLSDQLQSFDRIVSGLSASVPKGNFDKGKNGLNGLQGYIHLENLTQLMKSKDTKSVIELLSGINGNHNAHRESAGLRSTMNGSDPDLSDKVKISEQLNNFGSEQVRVNSPHPRTNQSGKDAFSNDPDPFMMVVENSESLTAASNFCTRLNESMVIDSELPLQLDTETPSESTNNSRSKDAFSFEEKVLSTAEDLLLGLAESSPPKASVYDEDEEGLSDLMATSLEDTLSRQQMLRGRGTRLVDRLRKLQFAQVGLHAKDEIGWFTSRVQSDATKVTSNDCLICKQRKLCQSDNSAFVPCEKHANSPPAKPGPPPTVAQRIITRSDGKEVFRNIENMHRRLQSNLVHLQDQIDSEATDGSSDESDEESEFKLTYQKGPNRGYNKLSVNRRAIWKWAQHRAGVARRWTWLQAQVSDLEYRIRQHSDIYRQIKAAKGTVTLETRPSASQERRYRSGPKSGRRLPPNESKVDRTETGHAVSPSPLSAVLSNVDHQSARLHKSLSNCLAPSGGKPTLQLNGCVHSRSSSGDLAGSTKTNNHRTSSTGDLVLTETPEERHCARTRPVRFYRKRRLVRPRELSYHNPKARRLSSVRCGCCPPSMCVMCGGRFNKTKPLNPFSMPIAEKVSHLSPGFHQVLAFPGDIPLPVHFESLLNRGVNDRRGKTQKRQQKTAPLPAQLKGKKRNLKRLHKLRKQGKLVTPNNLPISQVFYKKKFNHLRGQGERQFRDGDIRILPRSKSDSVSLLPTPWTGVTTSEEELRRYQNVLKRRRSQAAESERKTRERSLSLPIPGATSSVRTPPESRAPTPTTPFGFLPAAALLSNKKTLPGDAYDIDNIVIPYSMLASTRVEKLHYKEIDTPQWRVVVNGKVMSFRDSLGEEIVKEEEVEEEESLSDDEYIQRHLRYEINEKKKFLAILAKQGAAAIAAGRRSRRTRNNSTASTPDPLSPGPLSLENCSLSGSFDASSPLSPSTLPNHYGDLSSTPVTAEPTVPRHLRSTSVDRRRTSFASDSSKSASLDEPEPVQGWSRRSFPLEDDEVEDMNYEQEAEEALYNFHSPGGGSAGLGLDSDEESFGGSDLEPEDLNDPEWTVVSKRKPQRSHSPTDDDPLVLHLKCAAKKEVTAVAPPAQPLERAEQGTLT